MLRVYLGFFLYGRGGIFIQGTLIQAGFYYLLNTYIDLIYVQCYIAVT